MILAGYETSTSTSSLILQELAYNRNVQSRLRKETQDIFRQSGGKFRFEDLNKMKYLDQVISGELEFLHEKVPPYHLKYRKQVIIICRVVVILVEW